MDGFLPLDGAAPEGAGPVVDAPGNPDAQSVGSAPAFPAYDGLQVVDVLEYPYKLLRLHQVERDGAGDVLALGHDALGDRGLDQAGLVQVDCEPIHQQIPGHIDGMMLSLRHCLGNLAFGRGVVVCDVAPLDKGLCPCGPVLGGPGCLYPGHGCGPRPEPHGRDSPLAGCGADCCREHLVDNEEFTSVNFGTGKRSALVRGVPVPPWVFLPLLRCPQFAVSSPPGRLPLGLLSHVRGASSVRTVPR